MADDFSLEFPELSNLPSFDLEDEKECSVSCTQSDNQNIEKIYEYLNNDSEVEKILLTKLKEFESKLDIYLKNFKK
jgi:hypothetical protein